MIEGLSAQEQRALLGRLLRERAEKPRSFAASFGQQRLWFLDQVGSGSAYNVPLALRLAGPLNVAALEKALIEILRRHEALRTSFAESDGQPRQLVAPSVSFALALLDLSRLPPGEREGEARRLAAEESERPFALAEAPLLRAALLRLGAEEHVLLVTMHHIVSDGWSLGVFSRELGALYNAFSSGEPSPLPALPVQYADFARWQRRRLQGEALNTLLDYWRRQLAGLPTLQLPTDRPRPATPGFRGACESMVLPTELSAALQDLTRREGVTSFMLLLAAFQVLLARYTGQDDIVVGSPIANRTRKELEGLIGFFVNTLVLRADARGDPTFREFLKRVREMALGAYAHQDLPFEKLVEALQPERDRSRTPLVQVMFALQNAPMDLPQLAGIKVSALQGIAQGAARFDLELHLWDRPEGLRATLVYNTELFEAATITRLLGHYRTLLEGIATNPGERLASLPLLTAPERHQVVELWNQSSVSYPAPRCVHEMVEEQARIRPEALAAQCGARKLTYRELDARAEALAVRLRMRGVQPESLVAVHLERSLEMLIAILAVWKAGAAYVPIDPEYPPERIRFMLDDTKAVVTLTRNDLAPDSDHPVASVRSAARAAMPPERLAYVIYTSGSTGRPKGVPIKHASLFNLICWHQQAYAVTSADRATQIAGPGFDGSVWEIWPYLAAGASVHIPDEATRLDAELMVRWLGEQRITLSFLPTPLAEAALREKWPEASALRVLLTGGDKLNQRPAPGLPFRLVNHYGPTENTVVSTCAEVPSQGSTSAAPAIGRPLPNTQAYVLDRQLQPVPVGVPGELFLGGTQLSPGYWNRPDLTAESFIAHPFLPGARLYRTGDLARLQPDGNIEFLGRIDHQVKIRGLRIELGEIEAAVKEHPAVRECVVVVREDAPGHKRLVAYVTLATPCPALSAELRSALERRLPGYMVPAAFVCLGKLPLTQNGKVDRSALPAPDAERSGQTTYVPPRTEWELKLARIWQDILQVEKVGAQDNFFDLGGHSLLIVRLIREINRTHQIRLGVPDLLRNPTVAEMARLVERHPKAKRQPAVIQLQKGRVELPVYFMYAGPDEFRLAQLMGERHPVFGIEVPWLSQWRHAVAANRRSAFPTIQQLVAPYAAALSAHARSSPCVLAGHSFGGLVAFEAAHELHRQGGKVELVMLFDTWAGRPNPWRVAWHKWRGDSLRLASACLVARWLLRHQRHRAGLFLGRLRSTSNELTTVLDEQGMPLPWPLLERLYWQITASYRPRRLESRGVLLRTYSSEAEKEVHAFDDSLGWSGLFSRGLEVIPMVGDHLSMIREHTSVLAREMNQVLKRHWSREPDKASIHVHEPSPPFPVASLDSAHR